ncbi:hypothetical protein [Croceicoccus ponticola]|uniref:hypothetical protein n=1 Tax=Croceicoccus ponticola TaxID=2217664 RepID=UPI0013E3AA7B|nr:hypothetical protein [Croceicoccus ponticola]
MTDEPAKGHDMADNPRETREDRLARQLRENLKRRKAQARQMRVPDRGEGDD